MSHQQSVQPVSLAQRPDLARIASWIEPSTHVLDLGCADGKLLAYLQRTKNVQGTGIERDPQAVVASVRRGVPVIQQDLEEGLALFEDQHFDTVVLSKTLQSMLNTEHILREMARVARYGIVSFPNFGYWTHGLSILAGRMPVSKEMPYEWYDTPNIHLCTLKDFQDLAKSLGLIITDRVVFNGKKELRFLPGLRGTLAVYRFESPFASSL
ncbi:MAG: methionine biosynthesis protein MetW [Alcaligenaceae bacterium]|uniref:methionine biosynthesis protein MetW n=1 Tax=Paenalcaligenes sp. TaxID=1966342 RepID=UPI0016AB33F5|nr:methionine biosynthesis protein MetW [Paenalcaligenes sp.]NLJ63710.1 methionine biosynthesis protein MetW [Alcaligenaceae bacterium]